jgi:hypothetical protein
MENNGIQSLRDPPSILKWGQSDDRMKPHAPTPYNYRGLCAVRRGYRALSGFLQGPSDRLLQAGVYERTTKSAILLTATFVLHVDISTRGFQYQDF